MKRINLKEMNNEKNNKEYTNTIQYISFATRYKI